MASREFDDNCINCLHRHEPSWDASCVACINKSDVSHFPGGNPPSQQLDR